MKTKYKMFFLLFVLFYSNIICQSVSEWKDSILSDPYLSAKEWKSSYIKYDFSPLWIDDSNSMVFGFIGDNYQRIYIKIISAEKDSLNSDRYFVLGKSMVKNNVCAFTGNIVIESIRCYDVMHYGSNDEYKDKGIKSQGLIAAKYYFNEDSTNSHPGVFEGTLISFWYLDENNKIQYDDIEYGDDSFCNNQFAGTWKGYKSQNAKPCNWGDYRIPLSGDLDIGAGYFSPNEKYLKNGWQNYYDAFNRNYEKAKAEESKEWWK